MHGGGSLKQNSNSNSSSSFGANLRRGSLKTLGVSMPKSECLLLIPIIRQFPSFQLSFVEIEL
ncbi:hypothetical protein K469DRAFT_711112 [Zopfia rhizophila CBS 207.26]|uniref:Uncharacterized protein n=1 Tax=Zopfia rhizophila CBS 207.26 TaxID=1314779 RepID=A0A6A6DU91_9PEZI|nr:hypothetical protein K469DRAFT_711112 [Zopfia rhizophila CBS 207.26]